MYRVSLLFIALLSSLFLMNGSVFAENDTFFRGVITEIIAEGSSEFGEYQNMKVQITDTPEAGTVVEIQTGDVFSKSASKNLDQGDQIILRKLESGDYQFVEKYRFNRVVLLIVLFAALCVLIAKKRGVYALFGLALTIMIIVFYLIPAITAGKSILLSGAVALMCITFFSVVIAHGLRTTTMIAVISILLTMTTACILAVGYTTFAEVFGTGEEMILNIQLAGMSFINFRGLFLLGVLLGALGVLDDVTTAQAAVVAELKHANPVLTTSELFVRGSQVGREHIISVINTLFLAYAGVSLPLMLMFYTDQVPAWAFLNTEMIVEEIIRTLVGSTALLLSVPLTTLLAALWYGRRPQHSSGSRTAGSPSHTHRF